MAKLKILSWLGGLNTRINKFRLKDEDSVEVVDVDLSNLEIKPQKGLDTSSTASGDYNFKGTWEADASATKFTESGDYLIKSYDNQNPKYNRRKYDTNGNDVGVATVNGTENLGVPVSPDSAPSLSAETVGVQGDTIAQSTIYTKSLNPLTNNSVSNVITADNGGLFLIEHANLATDSNSSGTADTETTGFKFLTTIGSANTTVLYNPTTKTVRRRNSETGAYLTGQPDVTIANLHTYFITGDYFVALDTMYENVYILNLVSGGSATTVALDTPAQFMTANNGFVQTGTTDSFIFNKGGMGNGTSHDPTNAQEGWNPDGVAHPSVALQLVPNNGGGFGSNASGRHIIISFSANDSNVFVKRNYGSRFNYPKAKNFYTQSNDWYKYEYTGTSNNNFTSGTSFIRYSNAVYNGRTSDSSQPNVRRWEVQCGKYQPTNKYPANSSNYSSQAYTYGNNDSNTTINTSGKEHWHNALLFLVPGFPSFSTTNNSGERFEYTGSGNSHSASLLAILPFIRKLGMTFTPEISSSYSFTNYGPWQANTRYQFGDRVTWTTPHPSNPLTVTDEFCPMLQAKRIYFDGQEYTAMLVTGALSLMPSGAGIGVGMSRIYFDHTAKTFSTYNTSANHRSDLQPDFTSANNTGFPHFVWTSFHEHYMHYFPPTGQTGQEVHWQRLEDVTWSWDDDGTKQVWCYPVSNHRHTPGISGGSTFPTRMPTAFDQNLGSFQIQSSPKIEILKDQSQNDSKVQIEVKNYSGSYEVRFTVDLLNQMRLGGTVNQHNLLPVSYPIRPFLLGSDFGYNGTSNNFYNTFTVHDKIQLATGTKTTQVTGKKAVGLTEGPVTTYNDIKAVKKYSLPMKTNDWGRFDYLSDNYIATESTANWGGSNSSTNYTSETLSSVTNKAILATSADVDASNSSFAITETAPTTSSVAGSIEDFHDKFLSINMTGASANDIILYNTTGTTHQLHKNSRVSGTTQFGTNQSSLSLNAFSIITKNGNDLLFIDSAGSGETIKVVDTVANYAISNGTTKYNFLASNAKDAVVIGSYIAFKSGTNEQRIYTEYNNEKYDSYFRLPFDNVAKFSGNRFYGNTVVSSSNDNVSQYKRGFVFFRFDLSALENAQSLYNSTSNGSIGSTIRQIKHVFDDAGNGYYFLFQDDNNFQYDRQAFWLYFDANRQVKILAEPETATISNVTTNNGASTFVPSSNADKQKLQVKDNLTISGSGLTTLTGVLSTKSSTNHQLASGSFSAGISTATVNAVRYVRKNYMWFETAEYGNISLKVDVLANDYTNVAEEVALTGVQSRGWLPIFKSANNLATNLDVSSVYFYASFEKATQLSGGADAGSRVYTTGGTNLYKDSSANIPYQYQYSFLKDISASGEPEMLLEGPTSDESSELQLTSANQVINVNMTSSIPTGVTKVRLYRVGGDYANYYKVVDLSISNNSIPSFTDTESLITTGFVSPKGDTGTIPDSITNISYANGIYAGSKKSKIYFSEYGNPHSWPEAGVIDLYGEITNIIENNGEFIVFTETAVYRVRGYSFDSMSAVKIPLNQGMSSDNRNSLVEYKNSLYFISADGLCVYNNGNIQVISSANFSKFPAIASPRSAWKDDVLFIFNSNPNSNINGVKMDMRNGSPVFSRISQKATSRAFYDQRTDKLYIKGSQAGSYTEGSDLSITHKSGEITMGDAEKDKIFFGFSILYKGSGSITFEADGSGFYTENLPNVSVETLKKCQFEDFVVTPSVNYSLSGSITVFGLEIDSEQIETFSYPQRYLYADVTYTGQPTINMFMDNGSALVMSPSTLVNSITPKTVRMYYPTNTTGNVAHYKATGSGFVENVTYERVAL